MEKKIEFKNYFILLIIILVTILSVFYARSWYNTTREYNSQNSIMLSAIGEINTNEISNYVLENPKFIIYASSGQNSDIKSFEKQFEKYIVKHNLQESIVYINTDSINKDEFTNQLKNYANEQAKPRINVNENASMYIFEDGKITHVINNVNDMKVTSINHLLKSYGMIDNE